MEMVKEILFTEEDIKKKVKELGKQLTSDYKDKNLLLVGILKGAVPFMADLMRSIDLDLEYDFMDVTSYDGTTSLGEVRILKDISTKVEGKDILIVEDIIDTGLTLSYLTKIFQSREAKSVAISTLLSKPKRRKIDIHVKYIGYEIPDKFVVGYGMDYNEKFRALPYIGVLDEDALRKWGCDILKKRMGGTLFYFVLILLLFATIRFFRPPNETVVNKSVTEFLEDLKADKVVAITMVEDTDSVAHVKLKDGSTFVTLIPDAATENIFKSYIQEKVANGDIKYNLEPTKVRPYYLDFIPSLLMIAVVVFIWYRLMQQNSGGGRMNSFGKSKARMVDKNSKKLITFKDVAGLVEEKEELGEIVDFLKNPKRFTEMGARIPKGVLLVGPPGTGKTYLSRAVAGEAGVPFFIMSGSDFVEMFVGVGASRVRDLFDNAKKNAPCIIFIDEIDAVGRRRGAGLGGGHDEREQTLNQLLVEMDGFGTNEGVIVMAATNRQDILDPALLRPGRFDRTVFVGRPDIIAREEILKIHSKGKRIGDDVDLRLIARRTPGFTPADLENLMNEAALLAARNGDANISMEDVNEASIKVQAGPAKKSKIVSEKERRLTAVHESGHAIVSQFLPEEHPVHMITIIPRGQAGGFTAYAPEDDISFQTKGMMEAQIVSLLGGRVAESLVLEDISTGASNDIERATQIARAMVTTYGMSERLGTINFDSGDNEIFVGRDLGRAKNYSERTAAEIDEEVARIINEAYIKCRDILRENMPKLLKLSDALLEKETIYRKEFLEIMEMEGDKTEISNSKTYGDDKVLTKESVEGKTIEEIYKGNKKEDSEKSDDNKNN